MKHTHESSADKVLCSSPVSLSSELVKTHYLWTWMLDEFSYLVWYVDLSVGLWSDHHIYGSFKILRAVLISKGANTAQVSVYLKATFWEPVPRLFFCFFYLVSLKEVICWILKWLTEWTLLVQRMLLRRGQCWKIKFTLVISQRGPCLRKTYMWACRYAETTNQDAKSFSVRHTLLSAAMMPNLGWESWQMRRTEPKKSYKTIVLLRKRTEQLQNRITWRNWL